MLSNRKDVLGNIILDRLYLNETKKWLSVAGRHLIKGVHHQCWPGVEYNKNYKAKQQ